MLIPNRLIRSVPEKTGEQVEGWWEEARALHPSWAMVTFRDPIDASMFPRTSHVWHRCTSGAQLAGLVRLEALWWLGGVWIDSDVQCLKPLDEFLTCGCFAAWEDDNTVPDAIIGASPMHPAIDACLRLAIDRIQSSSHDWRVGNGAWATGPGVTTTILPAFDGVTLFGPDRMYPIHYTQKGLLEDFDPALYPDAVTLHHWRASWLDGVNGPGGARKAGLDGNQDQAEQTRSEPAAP